jgi:ABC-type dipeptide/oligopeptide/nickel transport system permease component
MIRYLVTRTVQGLLSLLLLTAFIFILMRVMMSGDFASQYVLSLSTERVAAVRDVLGVNRPAVAEYLNWGAMVYNAFAWGYLGNSLPWPMIIAPSLALSLFAASFYFIARGLHDVSDPRSQSR